MHFEHIIPNSSLDLPDQYLPHNMLSPHHVLLKTYVITHTDANLYYQYSSEGCAIPWNIVN